MLHAVPGDALAAEITPAVGLPVEELLPWRDVLHDGPVPARPEACRARRGPRCASVRPRLGSGVQPAHVHGRTGSATRHCLRRSTSILLWFEPDLVCALALAQVADRLASHPAPVWLVSVPHRVGRNLQAARRRRDRFDPRPDAFAALRSPDPRAWAGVPAFTRLLAELPDVRTGLSRLEREILAALRSGPLSAGELFAAISARERPPWIADHPLFAVADDLDPLASRLADGKYAITADGVDVLAGRSIRPTTDRWLGGVHLGPGCPDWRWDPRSERAVMAGRPEVVIQEAAANRLDASPTRYSA